MSSPSDRYSDKLCAQRLGNGDPCTSRPLRDKRFFHYHELMGPSAIKMDNQTFTSTHVYLPQLADAVSIQSAISEVCELMLHRRIEPKEATALFYAMQVASTNLYFLNGHRNPTLGSRRSSDSASDPKQLPPGTIQACEQTPRRKRRLRSSPGVRPLESMP